MLIQHNRFLYLRMCERTACYPPGVIKQRKGFRYAGYQGVQRKSERLFQERFCRIAGTKGGRLFL